MGGIQLPKRNVANYPSTLTCIFGGLELADDEGENVTGIGSNKNMLRIIVME